MIQDAIGIYMKNQRLFNYQGEISIICSFLEGSRFIKMKSVLQVTYLQMKYHAHNRSSD